MSKNDSDNDMERKLADAEAALPETITPARPVKETLPVFLIEKFAKDHPELDWSTPEAIRANFKIIWKQKQEPDAK